MHRDLPLVFERRAAPARETRPARPDRLTRLLGRLHPRLGIAWSEDRDVTRRVPVLAAVPVLLAVAGVVLFGVMRLGILEIYSESLLLVIMAVAIGMLSPTVGAAFVVAIGVSDLVQSWALITDWSNVPVDDTPLGWWPIIPAILGRVASYVALWILAVEIPLISRQAASSPPVAWIAARVGAATPAVLALAAGVTAGVLTLLWTAAFPIVARVPYTWANVVDPTTNAVVSVQTNGSVIAIAGAVAGAAAMGVIAFVGPSPTEARAETRSPGHLSWIVPRVVLLLLLGGLLVALPDLVVLLGALVVGPLLAQRVWALPIVPQTVGRVPGLVRLLAAFGVTVVIGQMVAATAFEGLEGWEFFPVTVTVAIGVVLYDLVFGPPAALDPARGRTRIPAAAAAALVVGAGVVFIMLPSVAFADNCSGPSDCYSEPILLAAGAAAAGGGMLLRRNFSPGPPPYTPGPPYGNWNMWNSPGPSEREWFRLAYKRKLVEGGWKPAPTLNPGPTDPNTPVFASSGTGTKA